MGDPSGSEEKKAELPPAIEGETRVPTNPGVGPKEGDDAPKEGAPAAPIAAPPPSRPSMNDLPRPPPDDEKKEAKPADEATTNVNAAPAKAASAPPPPRAPSRPSRSEIDPKAPVATGPLGAYEALARAARLPDIVDVARKVLGDAATKRRADFTSAGQVAEDAKLARVDADTLYGNALKVLEDGPEGEMERALACALAAHSVAEMPRKTTEDEDKIAGDLLWLATNTAFDAIPLLVRALGDDDANDIYVAVADRVRRAGKSRANRAEAIVGAAALAAGPSARAKSLARDLAKEIEDPVLGRILGASDGIMSDEVRLEGEMLPTPRGPVATTLLAITGILFVVNGLRLAARLALAYKRPTEVFLSDAGVRIKTRTEMLGRTLREREHVIVRAGLVRVMREVRYPRAAFYAGLLALALGSCVGVRTLSDGVRAASPSLLLVGLVIILLGIAADFALVTLVPGTRGRVRIAFVPKSGRAFTVGELDPRRADEAIARSLRGSR